MKEEADSITQLLNACEAIRNLHEDVCITEHALYERGEEYKPYEPTFFLYNYFCFNIIFNIDWKESVKSGCLLSHKKKNEIDQIKSMIDFCFTDGFVRQFLPSFRKIITMRADASRILNAMNKIVPDNVNIDSTKIGSFQASCKRLLLDDMIKITDLKEVYHFIYDVRCNVVHGTKTMQHMRDPGQRDRITTYSFFIIGLLHMLFMRLEFEDRGYYNDSMSERFISRILCCQTGRRGDSVLS